MAQIQSSLEAVFSEPPRCPASFTYDSVAELYAKFQVELEERHFVDLLGRKITFQAKEFPHLVKLEFFNSKQNAWSDALAKFAIPALKAGTLDSSRYRIGDASRPRTLFWVPDILQSPDSIHPNKRNPKNSVYAKRYKRDGTGSSLKIVLVQVDDRGTLSVQTSFWSNDRYHKGCVSHPAYHPNRESHLPVALNALCPGTGD